VWLVGLFMGLALYHSSSAQDTIWFEGFDYADGTTDPGNVMWSLDVSDISLDADS